MFFCYIFKDGSYFSPLCSMTENQTVMAAVWLAEVGPKRRTWKRGSKRICSFIKLKNKITKKKLGRIKPLRQEGKNMGRI